MLAVAVALATIGSTFAAEGTTREAHATDTLRVCADPNNLPFSNKAGEGFENKIVDLIAGELGLEVQYTWFPQTVGFVRQTLRLRECDLIPGIATTSQLVQNTNPYYRSVYAMVYRADSGIEATSIGDAAISNKRFGVIAGTPPATLLAMNGLLAQLRPYHRTIDSRHFSPPRDAIEDVVKGEIDIALVWGPIAGYYSKRFEHELRVVPMLAESPAVRLDFRVSMAVRHSETKWKRQINRILRDIQPKIDELLAGYDVPLLDEQGRLIAN
jgi:quinoprotein dehydrogenase-associated probable ABC transporter substrate-binding protein